MACQGDGGYRGEDQGDSWKIPVPNESGEGKKGSRDDGRPCMLHEQGALIATRIGQQPSEDGGSYQRNDGAENQDGQGGSACRSGQKWERDFKDREKEDKGDRQVNDQRMKAPQEEQKSGPDHPIGWNKLNQCGEGNHGHQGKRTQQDDKGRRPGDQVFHN